MCSVGLATCGPSIDSAAQSKSSVLSLQIIMQTTAFSFCFSLFGGIASEQNLVTNVLANLFGLAFATK